VRLKKVANPVATVRSSASWFMKPTIRTSFDTSSWMTAGMSPSGFEKSRKLKSLAGYPARLVNSVALSGGDYLAQNSTGPPTRCP
jgi:hypothetical protein